MQGTSDVSRMGCQECCYRYKHRIIREETELLNSILATLEDAEYRYKQLINSLEDSVILNTRLRDSDNYSPKVRIEAGNNIVTMKEYLYRLTKFREDTTVCDTNA
jgi:hypothetical protein